MGLLNVFNAGNGRTLGLVLAACLTACQTTVPDSATDMVEKLPVVTQPWDAVRIGVYDPPAFARLFTQIGGYTVTDRHDGSLTLQQNGVGARIFLERMPATAPRARSADAQSWEPGCYWSLMMRAKDIPSIVADAALLGWRPKTPVAYLEFGPSQLNVVVLTHQATGAQVQLYERLTTPLPDSYPAFARFGVPFNVMQMASDRDATYAVFTEELGFATWYKGDPFVSEKPEVMPLGIPVELTTTVPYRAAIVSPVDGMETGRFEMIEVMGADAGLTGRDFTATCRADSVGLTHVIYRTDMDAMVSALRSNTRADPDVQTDVSAYDGRRGDIVTVTAPDGASIVFASR